MTITRWTLRQRKWSTFWWAIGVAALISVTLAFYPTLHSQTNQLDSSFANIPDSARALFTDTSDLFSPVGYLSSQLYYLMLPLVLSILAIGLGCGLVAREESSGTLELLLSRPVPRGKLLFEKSAAGLIVLTIVGAAAAAAAIIMCRLVNMDVGLAGVGIATLYATVLAGLYGSIALFISSLGRTGRLAAIGVSAFVALASYIISSLGSVVAWLKWPAKFLPNHYYHPGDILYGHYSWPPLIVFSLIIIGFVLLSYLAFRRRDLTGN